MKNGSKTPVNPLRLSGARRRLASFRRWLPGLLAGLLLTPAPRAADAAADPDALSVERLKLNGEAGPDGGQLTISATLKPPPEQRTPALYATRLRHTLSVDRHAITHALTLDVEALRGTLRELSFPLRGKGLIQKVEAPGLRDWSVRRNADESRTLVLHLQPDAPSVKRLSVQVWATTRCGPGALPHSLAPLCVGAPTPALFTGCVRIETVPGLGVTLQRRTGLSPVKREFLPAPLQAPPAEGAEEPRCFQFHGTDYQLGLVVTETDPEARRVVLRDFQLRGELADRRAHFTLTATAHVKRPEGGALTLLRGGYALTAITDGEHWTPKLSDGGLEIVFARAGVYPLKLEFDAAVTETPRGSRVDFQVAPAPLQPILLRGLPADTEFRFPGAAKPERADGAFRGFLPPDGRVALSWTRARPETEGRLFYAAEGFSQVAISPGLLRQTLVFEFKVMQGELNQLTLLLDGEGEVTHVQGDPVLAWNILPDPDHAGRRRLTVQFNQPRKEQFTLQVQTQAALGAFPRAVTPLKIVPEGATRFGGYARVINRGAVRLEVLEARGLSQISPGQLPQSAALRALFARAATQVFAFRFSGDDFALRVQADNILPELSVSEVLAYHLGGTDLAIDAELELDIREAPVRELLLRVPASFVVARLTIPHLADHTRLPDETPGQARLRLTFSQPVAGRQLLQLRLERNAALDAATWELPRVAVVNARSTRGHVGVSADAGFRLTPARTRGLTDVATAFFPKQTPNLQAAFRITDPAWQAALRVERLPQSIQASVFHLFSVGEAIAYGSSVMNYVISGAPLGRFRVALSDEYFNVEFTGKDVLNWKKTDAGYEVQLATPVAGEYTLLATYERPFKPQGETLTFTGARPLDAGAEQGYTIVISTYQFQVRPEQVSSGLLAVEPGEVPAEYRLFFDAPILAAYRYTSRPFNLALALKPLAQAGTLPQVVDRAAIETRVSQEGQILTTVRYFVKNKGRSNLRIVTPPDSRLWEATVDGRRVVPVRDGDADLLALPQTTDPNAIHRVRLQLAAKSKDSRRLTLTAPAVRAPVLLTQWTLQPDENHRLRFRGGTLTPTPAEAGDVSGFAGLEPFFADGAQAFFLLVALGLFFLGGLLGRWATGRGVYRGTFRHVLGGLAALVVAGCGAALLGSLILDAGRVVLKPPTTLHFLAPVQQAGSTLRIEVSNDPLTPSVFWRLWRLWPAVLGGAAALAWGIAGPRFLRRLGWAFLGTGLIWSALRWPNGLAPALALLLLYLLLGVLLPLLIRLARAPRPPAPPPATEPPAGPDTPKSAPPVTPAATGAAGLLLAALLGGASPAVRAEQLPVVQVQAAPIQRVRPPAEATALPAAPARSVTQTARVEGDFVTVQARVDWRAEKGAALPLLEAPGVLTDIRLPDGVRLFSDVRDDGVVRQARAAKAGRYEIAFTYQVAVERRQDESGFHVPTPGGLINRLSLTVAGLDVDVVAPDAVSVTPVAGADRDTRAELVLAPATRPWVGWKPRTRDTRKEKPVFYAECHQLFVPTAGVIEGFHVVQVRPAQGELNELTFTVPAGLTITDVHTPALAFWRFDPDRRQLRVRLNPAQAKPFALTLSSQRATRPLPYEAEVGLIAVNAAAAQVGLAGVATGNEVQLDRVTAPKLAALNLDDFPSAVLKDLPTQRPGLTLRRAFQYANPDATLTLAASPVEPDVRVVSRQTLSLGEDRRLLAAGVDVTITRAGIFKLSFPLPEGLEVESISGPALSHWTELKSAAGRIITLHLKGRTDGRQRFDLTLAGPGLGATNQWPVPRLSFREATKQRGQLIVVPEQGMRLQPAAQDGVIPLDPKSVGARRKSALAFRLLNPDWRLTLDIERVAAWVQVTSFQQVAVREGRARVTANLDYQIENSGLRALRVRLPEAAENVRMWLPRAAGAAPAAGPKITDYLPVPGSATNATQSWNVKLDRRVIGRHRLSIQYTRRVPDEAASLTLRGVVAEGVNVQRGFFATQAGGRLQLRLTRVPDALLPADWESVPASLRRNLATTSASHVFRLVNPDFALPVGLRRHSPAVVLPAQVQKVTLTSVISDAGVMLTRGRVELDPGDKRLLRLRLPKAAEFWFAFVNESGVWLWRENEDILIPLQQTAAVKGPTVVDFYYTTQAGRASTRRLDLRLHGPRFDLPLQNIQWRVFLDAKWELADWSGALQMRKQAVVTRRAWTDFGHYLERERLLQRRQTETAKQSFEVGNRLLSQGKVQQARRFLQNAYQLSQNDLAFNEDARVRLQTLKAQQALVGLNVNRGLQQPVASQSAEIQQILENDANFTPDQVARLSAGLSAEDQAALNKLAAKIVEQQDAAGANPTAIRASLPEAGRQLIFTRSLLVDPLSELTLHLDARARTAGSGGVRFLALLAAFAICAFFLLLPRRPAAA